MAQADRDQIETITVPQAAPVVIVKDKVAELAPQPLDVEEPESTRSRLKFFIILISLYLVLFIGALDQTIIATSIPTIAADLDSGTGYAWFGSAYLLANAATGPVWAKFSDIWGRKPALLGAVVWFAIGSLIAALSNSGRMFIAARALQGSAAGGLAPLVSIAFADLFSVRNRSLYLGIREVIWACAGLLGPLMGGALTQYASWRWNFWLNLPVCAVAFVLLFNFLDLHNPRTAFKDGIKAFDWLGAILIIGVTLMILLGLDFGGIDFSWSSPTVLCLIVFGCVAVGIFLYVENSIAKHPLMPLRVFQNRSVNAAFAVGFLNGMVYISLPYYLPLYLQSVKALSPFQSGLMILPLIIPGTTAGFLSGIIIHRFGRYVEFIWAGMGLLTLVVGLYTNLDSSTSLPVIGVLEALGGIALAMLFQAPALVIQNSASQEDTAATIATYGFTRNMSTAISLVLGGVVFQSAMDVRGGDLRRSGLSPGLIDAFSGGKAASNVNLIQSITDQARKGVVEMAFADSLKSMWIMYACISGLGFLASGLIKHKTLKTEHKETKTGIKRSSEAERETEA